MMRHRVLVGLMAVTFALAGCGGDDGISDLSADQILAKTKTVASEAESLSVSGEGENEGSAIAIDLAFTSDTAEGSITSGGAEIELLSVDDTSYFRAGPEVYASFGADGGQVAEAIGDKWILIDPSDENFAQFSSFASRDEFLDELLDPDGDLTKTKEKTIDGVDTIGLKSDSGTLYVATDDGRPISLSPEEGGGTLAFSYDDIEAPDAPSADEVFDLSSLS